MSLNLFNRISLIIVLCLTISECYGQDSHYRSYYSYVGNGQNVNNDELKKLVTDAVERAEDAAYDLQLHSLSFNNYQRLLNNAQRTKRSVDSDAKNWYNLAQLSNEIKTKENILRQLWNGTNRYKQRRQEGMFLNTTAEKIHAENEVRNAIYRALNLTQGSNRASLFRPRRMVNDLNKTLNTINVTKGLKRTQKFNDFKIYSTKTEELNKTSNEFHKIASNNKTLTQDKNQTEENNDFEEITTEQTKYLMNTKQFHINSTEELNNLTSNELYKNALNNKTQKEDDKNRTKLNESSKYYEEILSTTQTKNLEKHEEFTTKRFDIISPGNEEELNNLTSNELYKNVLNNNTQKEDDQYRKLNESSKNFEEIKKESSKKLLSIPHTTNLEKHKKEFTTQRAKHLMNTKRFDNIYITSTQNGFYKNDLNNKTNLPESSENIDKQFNIDNNLITLEPPKNIVKHTEETIPTTKQTLGSRIIIHRVLQRNEVENVRPIMQMMSTLSIDGPHEDPVLIQVPPRRLNCPPHQRAARGRCRTLW